MFNLFKSKEEREAQKLFKEVVARNRRQYGPVNRLGLEIVRAASNCKDRTRYLVEKCDEETKIQREIYLFFEYLYFFSFLSGAYINILLKQEKSQVTRKYLRELISASAINTYFAHWPDDLKKNMITEFNENCDFQRDEYYALLENALSEEERFKRMFGCASENVVRLCERESEGEVLMPRIAEIVFEETRRSRFDLIVKKIDQTN